MNQPKLPRSELLKIARAHDPDIKDVAEVSHAPI
jgi:hypothetical protein